jgi:seryl-tRNA synthetase
MLDIKLIRDNPEYIAEQTALKGVIFDVEDYKQLEQTRKYLQITTQELQHERNTVSKEIGFAKAKGVNIEPIKQKISALGDKLAAVEQKLEVIQTQLETILYTLPNIPHSSVPVGKTAEDNKLEREWGDIPLFDFTPKNHYEITDEASQDCLDFTSAVKLSGARFVVLKGKYAKLQRAIGQFMLDLHTNNHGYTEVYAPMLVKAECMYGTGQFPKFIEDQFATKDDDLWLIPTAEVSVTNLVSDLILDSAQLPIKYACWSTCFRREAGTYGKDERGMIRQHQFEKVELVQIVHKDKSYQALEELLTHAEAVLQALKLPYRVMSLCTGDLGFQSAKTYDLEVWLPGQNKYREISSCSNFEAFQARRMKTRVKNKSTDNIDLVHTINGSGLAIGRTLIAIMENYQQADGRVRVPEVLKSYMGGAEFI